MRWLRNRWSPLLVALLLSLLVHFWLVGGLTLGFPQWGQDEQTPLAVRLLNPPSAKPAAPLPKPAKPEDVPPPEPAPKRAKKPAPQVEPESEPPPLPETALQPLPETPAPPLPEEQPQPQPQPQTALPSPAESEMSEESSYTAAAEEKIPPPRHVEIDFQVIRQGSPAGMEYQKYQVSDDGHYVLESLIQPKGLLALVLSDLVQKSEGQVTERGLRPSSFLYQYGGDAGKVQKAVFDWPSATISMQAGARLRTAELEEGAQDMLSFMYQFMFVPPLEEMQLSITNGKKLKLYEYTFEGEQTLDSKVGLLRVWHIGRSSGEGEEKIEIWLAPDYHYLPVKISLTEKDGKVTERLVTRLQIE